MNKGTRSALISCFHISGERDCRCVSQLYVQTLSRSCCGRTQPIRSDVLHGNSVWGYGWIRFRRRKSRALSLLWI